MTRFQFICSLLLMIPGLRFLFSVKEEEEYTTIDLGGKRPGPWCLEREYVINSPWIEDPEHGWFGYLLWNLNGVNSTSLYGMPPGSLIFRRSRWDRCFEKNRESFRLKILTR